jgi:hypothetical protein
MSSSKWPRSPSHGKCSKRFCKTQPDTSHVNSKAMLFTLTAVVFLAHLARTVWLVTRPEDEIIKYVPDDAFYYVNLAKHFASIGAWTFDGSTVATGFHLAWAYLLAVIFALWPSITFISLLLLAGVISSLAIAFSAYIVCLIALRRFGPSASIGAALVFLSPPGEFLSGTKVGARTTDIDRASRSSRSPCST